MSFDLLCDFLRRCEDGMSFDEKYRIFYERLSDEIYNVSSVRKYGFSENHILQLYDIASLAFGACKRTLVGSDDHVHVQLMRSLTSIPVHLVNGQVDDQDRSHEGYVYDIDDILSSNDVVRDACMLTFNFDLGDPFLDQIMQSNLRSLQILSVLIKKVAPKGCQLSMTPQQSNHLRIRSYQFVGDYLSRCEYLNVDAHNAIHRTIVALKSFCESLERDLSQLQQLKVSLDAVRGSVLQSDNHHDSMASINALLQQFGLPHMHTASGHSYDLRVKSVEALIEKSAEQKASVLVLLEDYTKLSQRSCVPVHALKAIGVAASSLFIGAVSKSLSGSSFFAGGSLIMASLGLGYCARVDGSCTTPVQSSDLISQNMVPDRSSITLDEFRRANRQREIQQMLGSVKSFFGFET